MGITLREYQDYLINNKSLVLATVTGDITPNLRHIGGYNLDGKDIVFQTTRGTDKTADIEKNAKVAAVFQHEGQTTPKNITVYGRAEALEGADADKAVELIKARRPQLNYNPKINIIYKIKVETVKNLDFTAENKQQIISAEELI